jgi:hypothetical protein
MTLSFAEILMSVMYDDSVKWCWQWRTDVLGEDPVRSAPQLSISQKTLGTLPEDGNVMPKHVWATIHN